jgi:hypothetical protein
MSNRIVEILEVIEDVRERYLESPNENIKGMRVKAIHLVAELRQIDERSVLDKCTRQLQPDVKDAAHFDQLVEAWLKADSKSLRQTILKHSSDSDDEILINSFFQYSSTTDVDVDLAKEFGYKLTEKKFVEGKAVLKLHLVKERDAGLVKDAKLIWNKEQDGNVLCSVCEFSFLNHYGEIGQGYIEAHHRVPISALTSETEVTANDLAPVCSNCHRMLHRRRPWMSIDDLRKIVSETSS